MLDKSRIPVPRLGRRPLTSGKPAITVKRAAETRKAATPPRPPAAAVTGLPIPEPGAWTPSKQVFIGRPITEDERRLAKFLDEQQEARDSQLILGACLRLQFLFRRRRRIRLALNETESIERKLIENKFVENKFVGNENELHTKEPIGPITGPILTTQNEIMTVSSELPTCDRQTESIQELITPEMHVDQEEPTDAHLINQLILPNLVHLAREELDQLTQMNTSANAQYQRPIEVELVQMKGPRPPSPNAKTLAKYAEMAHKENTLSMEHESFMNQNNEDGQRHVKWPLSQDQLCSIFYGVDRAQYQLSSPSRARRSIPQKSCIRDGISSSQPHHLSKSPVVVKRILYNTNHAEDMDARPARRDSLNRSKQRAKRRKPTASRVPIQK